MVTLFALLLVIFLIAFFGLDQFTQLLGIAVANDNIPIATINNVQIMLSRSELRVFLGGGIVFFEFAIIMLSMFDRVLDSLKAVVKPITVLVPLIGFVYSVYQTFSPVVKSLLPTEIGGAEPGYIATAAQDETLGLNVLLTFGMMLLYLAITRIVGGDSPEVKALKAENARLKKELRRGL